MNNHDAPTLFPKVVVFTCSLFIVHEFKTLKMLQMYIVQLLIVNLYLLINHKLGFSVTTLYIELRRELNESLISPSSVTNKSSCSVQSQFGRMGQSCYMGVYRNIHTVQNLEPVLYPINSCTDEV